MERNAFGWITIVLVIVGAINWGLVGVANFNLVDIIFGAIPWLLNIVYILVGLSGLWELFQLFN
jgi:uncharacterized membrane protein YuzA (DUF378 family)